MQEFNRQHGPRLGKKAMGKGIFSRFIYDALIVVVVVNRTIVRLSHFM